MTDKIVVIDFSGTLIKPFVAEEANLKRYKILGIKAPSEKEHKKMHATKSHYEIVKQYIAEDYGLTDEMQIDYVQNYGNEINLSGKDVKTIIMTDLFRNAMYQVAKEHGMNIFPEKIAEVLQKMKERGYKLAIVSGIRKDIITGIFTITKFPVSFDYIYAQDPVLSKDDNKLLDEELAKKGKIEFIIGDKTDDLCPAKNLSAKSIFVKWGHPIGGEEKMADFTIEKPEELLGIIK